MKRALKAVAAASIVLGTMAPAAFASTSSITWGKKNIQFQKYTANGVYGYAEDGTTYMPVWYVLQALKNSGYSYTYDGKVLNISTPSGVTPNTSGIDLGTGNLTIQINGQDVKKVYTEAHKDPAGGKNAATTVYIPIWYIQQILDAVNFHNTWDGTNWKGQQLSSITASAANDSVSVGQGDQVTVVLKDSDGNTVTPSQVKYSVTDANGNDTDGASISSHGVFTANQPGTYIVTANADGIVATTKITVYGQAANVELSSNVSNIVADGAATATITAKVVDANGNPVSNYNGPVNVYLVPAGTDTLVAPDGTKKTGTLAQPLTYTAKNGQVQITLNAGSVPNSTDSVYASIPGGSWQSISLSTVAPQATAVAVVNAPKSINSATAAVGASGQQLTIGVLDQAGNLLSSGTYNGTVTLSGPAEFADGTQTKQVTLNNGTTTITIYTPNATTTGTVTVTPNIVGLTSQSVQLPVYIPGTATKLALANEPATTTFSADTIGQNLGSPFLTYNIQAVDANGNQTATSAPTNLTASVTYNGQNVSWITASPSGANGVYTVTLTGNAGTTTIPAGTYTVTIKDSSANSSITGLTETFTITPGKPNTVVVSPSSDINVPLSNPSTTITAQVQDAWGNKVNQSGVIVDFTAAGTNKPSLSATQVATNAQGVATVTATEPATAGDNGVVQVAIDPTWAAQNGVTPAQPVNSGKITVVNSVATKVTAQVVYPSGQSNYVAGSSNYAQLVVSALNSAGAPITGDTLQYTITGPNGYTKTGTVPAAAPNATVTLDNSVLGNSIAPGNYTITVTDQSAAGSPSATTTFTVVAGAATAVKLFDANGVTTSETVNANEPVALWVKAVDAANNGVAAPVATTVTLSDGGRGGAFELTPGGAPVTSVILPAGSTGVQVYYVNSQPGTYNLSATYTPVVTTATFTGGTAAVPGTNNSSSTYTWTVKVTDQFGKPITNLSYTDFTVADATTGFTFTGAASAADGSFTVSGGTNGVYTITAQSAAPVTTTDAAKITVGGVTLNGSF